MKAQNSWKTFVGFALRVIVAHMLTYFVFGMIMSNVFDYGEVFKREVIRDYMIPMDQHNIVLGPFLQPIRGLIFAIGLWPLRDLLIERRRGWLILWGLLLTIGILSTPAAAPASVEGMLYTKLPLWYHLIGLPEITLQTLIFSIWLVWWERQSTKSRIVETKNENPLVAEIIKAATLACFAFIGYAVGGIILALRANALAAETGSGGVDIEAAGASFRMQFMFVIAFIINALTIFWLARRVQAKQLKLWTIFPMFWFIDAFVPWLYQTVVFASSHIPTAIMLGFFPAAIISASMWMSYRQHLQPI